MSDYSSRYRAEQKRVPTRNPWLEQQLKAGASREQLLADLEERGWSQAEAEAALAASAPRVKHRLPTARLSGLTLVAALGATTVASILGGLAWALVCIVTRYDIGIVAWIVGVMAGTAVVRVAGGRVAVPLRLYAATAAAAGMLLGKYVVFVHDLKDAVRKDVGSVGAGYVHYGSTATIRIFFHDFTAIVRPIYLLWIGITVVAALRVAGRPPR